MNTIASLPTPPLTARGQKFDISSDLRRIVCLTADGVLHIVSGYQTDPHVFAFRDTLRRANYKVESEKYVSAEELSALYKNAESKGSLTLSNDLQEITSRQREVVKIIRSATELGASDVHFFATTNGHQLKFRINGELEIIKSFVGNHGALLESAIYTSMIEAGTGDEVFRPNTQQDGRLKSEFVKECGLYGARIATRPTINGCWMVLRLLYNNSTATSLNDMGYLREQVAMLETFVHSTEGIFLQSGTTGSGKSTSLQALMLLLLRFHNYRINLATIEDPVEYKIEGAQQTPLIGEWADAIKNMMRMDPDALMVGEIRDLLSAVGAFQGALTGHMLWSTLHTQDAAGCIQRLHDLGVESSLLFDPSLIQGLINQSLTRVICPHCRIKYTAHRNLLPIDLQKRIETRCIPDQVYLKGPGCERCNSRGVIRRTAIAEIIPTNLQFMRKFRDEGKAEAQAFWVHEMGGITKNAHAIIRINEGLVDPQLVEKDVCRLDKDVITLGVRP